MARMLVVEDDLDMASLLWRGLADEGHRVHVETDGVAGLLALPAQRFDAAAIDVKLPEMTGFEVCRRMRQLGHRMPIILLTARDAVDDRVFGLDSGADDYLSKPFAIAELHARLRALLRRADDAPTLVTAGVVRLDTVDRTAGGAETTMTIPPVPPFAWDLERFSRDAGRAHNPSRHDGRLDP